MGMMYERQLAIPAELKEMYPLTAKMNETIQTRKAELVSIFEGRRDRLILIIGPCSADNEDSVMDYIGRLVPVQEKVKVRINKGIRDITEAKALNSFTPQSERRIPYRNMIYIGDGLTDVPCMKLVKLNGGRSIGVYQGDDDSQVCDLIRHDRVNYITRADYRFDQELASIVKKLIVSIKKEEELEDITKLHQSKAL